MTIQEKLQSLYPNGMDLGYVDYRDNLNDNKDVIKALMEGDMDFVYEKTNDRYIDGQSDYIQEIIENEFDGLTEDEMEEVREWCYENNTFDPLKQLCKNTGEVRCRLVYRSNYEAMNRGEMDDEQGETTTNGYYKDLVKQNIMEKKYLDEVLAREWREHTSDFGEFTFCGELSLVELLEKKGNKVKVKRGTQFGLHNEWNGSCGMIDSETQDDIIIDLDYKGDSQYDRRELILDDDSGYGVDETCGMSSKYWERGGFEFVA